MCFDVQKLGSFVEFLHWPKPESSGYPIPLESELLTRFLQVRVTKRVTKRPQKLIRSKGPRIATPKPWLATSGGLQALGQFLSEEIFCCMLKFLQATYVIEAITRSYRFFLVDSRGFPWPPGPSSLWRSFICSLHRWQFYSGFPRGRSDRNGQWFRWGETSSCQERGERNKEVEVRASDILDTYDSSEERFLDDLGRELSLLEAEKKTFEQYYSLW